MDDVLLRVRRSIMPFSFQYWEHEDRFLVLLYFVLYLQLSNYRYDRRNERASERTNDDNDVILGVTRSDWGFNVCLCV